MRSRCTGHNPPILDAHLRHDEVEIRGYVGGVVAFVNNKTIPTDLEEWRDDIGWYWWFALTLGNPSNG